MSAGAVWIALFTFLASLGNLYAWTPSYAYDLEEERVFTKRAGGDESTPNLEQEFKKRCNDFLKPGRPAHHIVGTTPKNCDELWQDFFQGFRKIKDGHVETTSFNAFFDSIKDVKVPKGKAAFYSGSKVREFFDKHPPTTTDLYTIENTLPGYVLNGLVFCGDPAEHSGLAKECPNHRKNPKSAWYAFWQRNSEEYAKKAQGQVHIVLSTDYPAVYVPGATMFAKYEIQVLKKIDEVSNMDLLLLKFKKDLDAAEGCTPEKGSIATLKSDAGIRLGSSFKCILKPPKLQALADKISQG